MVTLLSDIIENFLLYCGPLSDFLLAHLAGTKLCRL